MDDDLIELAEQLGNLLKAQKKRIATAESCTGGWIAQEITEISGSSVWFDRGFVTYSNLAKMEMLGVKKETLEKYGAVSAETVKEMASGALKNSAADCVVAVSGIAGPDGGTVEKPVGTVFLGWQEMSRELQCIRLQLNGSRYEIRRQAVERALAKMYRLLSGEAGGRL